MSRERRHIFRHFVSQ